MRFCLGFVCLLASVGCFSPQYHGPSDDVDRTGVIVVNDGAGGTADSGISARWDASEVGADLDGTLYARLRSDGHLINTERLRVLIGEPTLDCLLLHTLMESASLSDPNATIESNEVLWRSDRDPCDYIESAQDNWGNETYAADRLPIPVPVYAGVTVAIVGYNAGAQKPSLFSCRHSTSTDSLDMTLAVDEGYDPDLPARYNTLTERCLQTVR